MTGEWKDEVPSTSTQPAMARVPLRDHSHHWVPVRVGRKNGEPVNEMRCQECGTKYDPAKEAENE